MLFREALLESEESACQIPPGGQIAAAARSHLLIKGSEDGLDKDTQDSTPRLTRLALVSTIQFVAALQRLKEDITVEKICDCQGNCHQKTEDAAPIWTGRYEANIPRSKPLSPGEILGCTAPKLGDVDALL